MTRARHGVVLVMSLVLCLFGARVLADSVQMAPHAPAATSSSGDKSDLAVMEAFNRQQVEVGEAVRIDLKRKHEILFFMGITLLVLVLLTAYFGISMAIFGKQVFVQHMILAGLSVTLAIAHSIVAIVWFFPF